MAEIYFDVDAALSEVPVNIAPLIDDTDFKTIEGAVAYNAAGMALRWHFVTSAGAYTVTSVTPTTAGTYDWTDQGDSGIYTIEIPATGGASINNDTEGYGWFTGVATGVLPWRSPIYGFRAAAINDSWIDTNTTGFLAPTTAGRTLDVASTGEAGLDFANVTIPDGPVPALGIVEGGTAQSATATTLVGRAAGAVADDAFNGCILQAFGSTQGYWQSAFISDTTLSSDTFTVAAWPGATPSGTITYRIFGTPAASTASAVAANVTQWNGTNVATPTVAGVPEVDVTHWIGTAAATPTVAGVPEVDLTHVAGATTNVSALATNANAIKTKTDFLPSATAGAAGGVFIAGSNAATSITTALTANITGNLSGSAGSVTGAVGSVTGMTASDVGAIKTKTDQLTFTKANEIDANVQSLNGVTLTGDGGVGTEFDV